MSTRIVLIGAGSAQFGFDMLGDIFQSSVLAGCHVVLHDINAEALGRVHKAGQEYVDVKGLPTTISATLSREEALAGADFCVIAIEVGDRFALWEQDQSTPRELGLRQVFGENGGRVGSSIRCVSCRRFSRSARISRRSAPTPGCSTTATR